MTEKDQQRLQELSQTLQTLQDDLQSSIEARQKLEAQQTENRAVQKEFFSLLPAQQQQQKQQKQKQQTDGDGDGDEKGAGEVYRLVGPVLLKQDLGEARAVVEGRLEFIGKEIGRVEGRVKGLQAEREGVTAEVLELQRRVQAGTG